MPDCTPFSTAHSLARRALFAFLLTFISSRVLVVLIMTRRMPDLFLHFGGTHVHHLNYGIFMLSAVGAALLFLQLGDAGRKRAALMYGFGMALTFDEFGMWVHLGGSYWQRASYDAVVVVASVLGLIAFAPPFNRFQQRHWTVLLISVALAAAFGAVLLASLDMADRKMGPKLQEIEERGPQ